MKKHKKLGLRKFKIARLANTFSVKGGVITNGSACGVPSTEIDDAATVGVNSCIDTMCNNQTHEFESCSPTNTIETRTGDSLQNN
jgi:hypothetical protein